MQEEIESWQQLAVFEGKFLQMVEPMGFESTTGEKTKEHCGAAWPLRVLKGKGANS
jgi:hypothetical protein